MKNEKARVQISHELNGEGKLIHRSRRESTHPARFVVGHQLVHESLKGLGIVHQQPTVAKVQRALSRTATASERDFGLGMGDTARQVRLNQLEHALTATVVHEGAQDCAHSPEQLACESKTQNWISLHDML
jgi:hypothetical protein